MCSRCCFLASSLSKRSRLFSSEECRGTMPMGSRSRLDRFLRGNLPYDALCWPDGQLASARLQVWSRAGGDGVVLEPFRQDLEVASGSEEEAFQLASELNRIASIFAKPKFVPDVESLDAVFCSLDAAIARAWASQSAIDFSEVESLDLSKRELAECLDIFVGSRFQDFWVDELLEVSLDLELQLYKYSRKLES